MNVDKFIEELIKWHDKPCDRECDASCPLYSMLCDELSYIAKALKRVNK